MGELDREYITYNKLQNIRIVVYVALPVEQNCLKSFLNTPSGKVSLANTVSKC